MNKSHCHLNTESFEKIELLLQAIFQEFSQKQERYKEVIKASLEIIFIELVRQNRNPNKNASEAKLYAQERLEELKVTGKKRPHQKTSK